MEYTIFLPYEPIVRSPDSLRAAAECLLAGIVSVLQKESLPVDGLDARRAGLIEELCMLEEPWPFLRSLSSQGS